MSKPEVCTIKCTLEAGRGTKDGRSAARKKPDFKSYLVISNVKTLASVSR